MAFFLNGAFSEKMVQKSFKLLDRLRISRPDVSEIQCLLCADSSLLLNEIIFCTNQAVFYHPRLTNGLNRYDFPSISAVTVEIVNAYPSVCLTISGGEKSRLYVATKEAAKMADFIKGKISAASGGVVSVADEIAKLKALLDAGALTAEEFSAKKKQLLGI